ncbi:MAG: hypothetical protein R2688_04870 [Fimbriimonadaceae bacterium]
MDDQKHLTEDDMEAILLLAVQESSEASTQDIRVRLSDVATELGITPEQLAAAEAKHLASKSQLPEPPLFRLDDQQEWKNFRKSQWQSVVVRCIGMLIFAIAFTIFDLAMSYGEMGPSMGFCLFAVGFIVYQIATTVPARSLKNLRRFESYKEKVRNIAQRIHG